MVTLDTEDLQLIDERFLTVRGEILEIKSKLDNLVDSFNKEDHQSDEQEKVIDRLSELVKRMSERMEQMDRQMDEMERKLK